MLRNRLEFCLKWAVMMPLIVYLAKKFSLFSTRWPISLILHLGMAFIASAFINISGALIYVEQLRSGSLIDIMKRIEIKMAFTYETPFHVMTYGMTVFVIGAMFYYQEMKAKISEASQLQVQLAQAQLHALKTQLNPHFLFNTLHAVSSLMGSDINAAREMIARLSELLRLLLDFNSVNMVPLREELRALHLYLAIEQIRFNDRLTIILKVDDDTLDALIPHLLLQPLVENAIKHGIAPFSASGRLEICAKKIDQHLVIEVSDDGVGIDQEALIKNGNGIGLKNTEQRLRTLYKDQFQMTFKNNDEGGLTVALILPFQLKNEHEIPDFSR